MDKRRTGGTEVRAMNIIGAPLQGKTAVIFDDMISTAGSVVQAANVARYNGVRELYACATHAVFCGPAKARLEGAAIDSIVVTDTIPPGDATPRGVVTLSVGDLLGEAILRIHQGRSVSTLFPSTL